jgi:5-methylcytosine-specific restriction endonuclease McrBC regulatory subunit McrC
MQTTVDIVESKDCSLSLTGEEAHQLRALGRRLASDTVWWGSEDDHPNPNRSVISCEKTTQGRWKVRVREAVGVISVGNINIKVAPKIPLEHFSYIVSHSDVIPRTDEQDTKTDSSENLVDLIIRWFISSTEKLLRSHLSKGYAEEVGQVSAVRGQILLLETARDFYAGRSAVHCRYEEFNENTPLNRLLRAAAEAVVSNGAVSESLRRRARRILANMPDVGILHPSDLRAQVDRLSRRYETPVGFAKYILMRAGVGMGHGGKMARAFLIRTPAIIESGILSILKKELQPEFSVAKSKLTLGSAFTVNPDVVIDDGRAIMDIKYKIAEPAWSRADVYQLVAHAAAFKSKIAGLIYFSNTEELDFSVRKVQFGEINIRRCAWVAHEETKPKVSSEKLIVSVREMLCPPIERKFFPPHRWPKFTSA